MRHLRAPLLLTGFIALACGGLMEDTPPPPPPPAEANEVAQGGCDAAAKRIDRAFSESALRSVTNDGNCKVDSQGTKRKRGELPTMLTKALKDWTDAGRLAADGEDGTQFALRKGSNLCVIGIYWENVDGEQQNERVAMSCGPESNWPE